MLFDHLMQNPGWLLRYSGIGRRELPPVPARGGARGVAVPASLLRETDLRGAALRRARSRGMRLPDLYVETLTDATSFRYRTC